MQLSWKELSEGTLLGELPFGVREEAIRYAYDCAPLDIKLVRRDDRHVELQVIANGMASKVLFDLNLVGDITAFIDVAQRRRQIKRIVISQDMVMIAHPKGIIYFVHANRDPQTVAISMFACNELIQALEQIQVMAVEYLD